MSLPRSHASNAVAVVCALGSLLIASRINAAVELAYMDEIFHVPQARHFCSLPWRDLLVPTWSPFGWRGSVRYDDKLTTPPGLYLVSKLLSTLLPATKEKCPDIAFLRSTNLLMLLSLPFICAAILECTELEAQQRLIVETRKKSQPPPPSGTVLHLPPAYDQAASAGSTTTLEPRSVFRQSENNGANPTGPSAALKQRHQQGGISRSLIRSMQERAQDQQHQDSHQTPVSEAAQETPALPPQSARPTGPLEQSRRQSEDAATALQDILSSPSVSAKLRARSKEAYRTTLAHTIILLPPLYFFGFLYYTDVGSVTFVLAALLAVKKQRRGWAALLAAVSLLFRQTNVIWIGFIVVQDVLHRLAISGLGTSGFSDPILDSIPPSASAGAGSSANHPLVHLAKAVASSIRLFLGLAPASANANTRDGRNAQMTAWSILRTSATPFLPTLAAFAAFVRWNGAIVLGDKSNHRPEIHVPQLAYFLLFTGVFAWAPLLFAFSFSDELPLVAAASDAPTTTTETTSTTTTSSSSLKTLLLSPVGTVCRAVKNLVTATTRSMLATPARAVTTLAVSIAIWIAVDRFTLHHPFMLSDNRHFTFYIWRRVRAYPWILYALVPVYTLLLYAVFLALARSGRSVLWITAFALATAAALVPTPLVEPRYFITPFLLVRLHIQPCFHSHLTSVPTRQHPTSSSTSASDNSKSNSNTNSSTRPTQPAHPTNVAKWTFLLLELSTYVAINAVTIWLFLSRPFEWPASGVDRSRSESTTMRFMW